MYKYGIIVLHTWANVIDQVYLNKKFKQLKSQVIQRAYLLVWTAKNRDFRRIANFSFLKVTWFIFYCLYGNDKNKVMRKSSIKSPRTIICIFVIIIRTVLGLTWVETKLQNCDLWCCQAEGGVLRGGEPGLLLYRLRKWGPLDPSSNPADWRPKWSEGPAVLTLSKPWAQPPKDPALVLRWDIQAELTYSKTRVSLLWTLQRLPEKSLCQSPAIISRRRTPRSLPALSGTGWLCWTLSARPPKLTLASVLAHWLRFQRRCFIWPYHSPLKQPFLFSPFGRQGNPDLWLHKSPVNPDCLPPFTVQVLGHETTVPSYWLFLGLSFGLL